VAVGFDVGAVGTRPDADNVHKQKPIKAGITYSTGGPLPMPSRDYSDLSRLALEADLDVDELRGR
jgi:hypothetical protein